MGGTRWTVRWRTRRSPARGRVARPLRSPRCADCSPCLRLCFLRQSVERADPVPARSQWDGLKWAAGNAVRRALSRSDLALSLMLSIRLQVRSAQHEASLARAHLEHLSAVRELNHLPPSCSRTDVDQAHRPSPATPSRRPPTSSAASSCMASSRAATLAMQPKMGARRSGRPIWPAGTRSRSAQGSSSRAASRRRCVHSPCRLSLLVLVPTGFTLALTTLLVCSQHQVFKARSPADPLKTLADEQEHERHLSQGVLAAAGLAADVGLGYALETAVRRRERRSSAAAAAQRGGSSRP